MTTTLEILRTGPLAPALVAATAISLKNARREQPLGLKKW
jgi:hypothetical protein